MVQAADHSNSGNPEGISNECGKGGMPALWLSMLSIFCHFHGLLSPGKLDKPICRHPAQCAALATRRLSYSSVVNECIGDLALIEIEQLLDSLDSREGR